MKRLLIYILLIGQISCSTDGPDKNTTDQEIIIDAATEINPIEARTDYREIVLSEHTLDTFSIPFPEMSMLEPLKNHFQPYSVEAKTGQQDGTDYPYIDIAKDNNATVTYLNFDWENKFKLEEIRIIAPSAVDQYGIRVGDTYQQVIEKRKESFSNSTDYHEHTYLYSDNSNIYYELSLNFTIADDKLENIEELVLTEEQLQKCSVENIIWRNRN